MAAFPEASLATAQGAEEGLLTDLIIRLSITPREGQFRWHPSPEPKAPHTCPGRGREGREVVGAATATHGFFLHLTGLQDLGFLPCEVLPSPWEVTGAEPTLVDHESPIG